MSGCFENASSSLTQLLSKFKILLNHLFAQPNTTLLIILEISTSMDEEQKVLNIDGVEKCKMSEFNSCTALGFSLTLVLSFNTVVQFP